MQIAVRDVRAALDEFSAYDAAMRLIDVAEGLSNWYVRRSRERFWGPGLPEDKRDAYATLHEALVTLALLMAPFVPFIAEEIYQNLVVGAGLAEAHPSVHLAPYPEVRHALIDEVLAREMRAVRDIVSLGLSVRTANKLPVLQPLEQADIVFNDSTLMTALHGHLGLIEEELNVKHVRFMFQSHEEGAVAFRIKANFRALGPRLGKNVQGVKLALKNSDGSALFAALAKDGYCEVPVNGAPVKLERSEVEVVVEAQPGFAAETGRVGVVVLHTTITPQLEDEGRLRRLLRRIQEGRKKEMFGYTDRKVMMLDLEEAPRLRAMLSNDNESSAEQIKQIELTCLVNLRIGSVAKTIEKIQIDDEWIRLSWPVPG